jgi:hypothetical protein
VAAPFQYAETRLEPKNAILPWPAALAAIQWLRARLQLFKGLAKNNGSAPRASCLVLEQFGKAPVA